MTDETTAQNRAKLWELIQDIEVAMLTTAEADGSLRSRPMMTQKMEFDGDLYFLTRTDAPKVQEVRNEYRVNLSYAHPGKQRYVSVSGIARLIHNPALLRDLWNPIYEAWFPEGPNSPAVGLIKVTVEKAEYWDSGANKISQLINFVKGVVGKNPEEMGENRKLDL